jgi:hypothetical protein
MEGDPEAPPPAVQKRILKEDYSTKAATVLGSLHLLCGLITLTASIEQDRNSKMLGIWCSVFFLISGGLATGGARSGTRRLVVATLVMAVISAVSAGILLIWKSLGPLQCIASDHYHCIPQLHSIHMCRENEFQPKFTQRGVTSVMCSAVYYGARSSMYALILTGLAMLVMGISSAAVTCRPLRATAGAVHRLGPVVHDTPATASLVLGQEDPPSYSDVVNSGSKYQLVSPTAWRPSGNNTRLYCENPSNCFN